MYSGIKYDESTMGKAYAAALIAGGYTGVKNSGGITAATSEIVDVVKQRDARGVPCQDLGDCEIRIMATCVRASVRRSGEVHELASLKTLRVT